VVVPRPSTLSAPGGIVINPGRKRPDDQRRHHTLLGSYTAGTRPAVVNGAAPPWPDRHLRSTLTVNAATVNPETAAVPVGTLTFTGGLAFNGGTTGPTSTATPPNSLSRPARST